ncbi:DUF4831 family protein [Proteiniphilum sp.]|uniref:DUF4831 family protein n=1 Tax=Proteiniphilum sp. TaxID=1926877 RepID=UPI002B20BAAF|nr:DUF4831 family protein [Proteiniphilum sp.]MEA4918350.1 DUF4831 family protein [Proteiniphilum sp.]
MMKLKYLILTLILAVTANVFAQKTTRVNAIKADNWGVIYSLPKTSFEVTFLVKKTTYRKGEFYPYAQRYLGIDNPVTEDRTVYTLEDISLLNKGIVDKTNSFMVEFRPKSLDPFVYLREDGVIVTINADPEPETPQKLDIPQGIAPTVNPRNYLSQETLMAGSTARQAELVARQIFSLRTSRTDILTGEADNMPPDGNAYKVVMEEINLQEKALTELFIGSEQTEYFVQSYTVVPDERDIDRKVIARFSEKLGPMDADNLAGEPVYFSLVNKTPKVEMQLSDKDLKRLETKLSEGIVYNVPGKAALTIEFRNKVLSNKEVDVVQYGTQDVLIRKMFENAKQPVKVYFYPELGAIKQVIQ